MITDLPYAPFQRILSFLNYENVLSLRLVSRKHEQAIISVFLIGGIVSFPDDAWPIKVSEFLRIFPNMRIALRSIRIASMEECDAYRLYHSRLQISDIFVLPCIPGVYSHGLSAVHTLLPHVPTNFLEEDLQGTADSLFGGCYGTLHVGSEISVSDLTRIAVHFPYWDVSVRSLTLCFSDVEVDLLISSAQRIRCTEICIEVGSALSYFGQLLPIASRLVCLPRHSSRVCAWEWMHSVCHRFLHVEELLVVVYPSRIHDVYLPTLSSLPQLENLRFWDLMWISGDICTIHVRFSRLDPVLMIMINGDSILQTGVSSKVEVFPLPIVNSFYSELVLIIDLPEPWSQRLHLPGSSFISSLTIIQKSVATCPNLSVGRFPDLLQLNTIGDVLPAWTAWFPSAQLCRSS
eukprot:ANDGO_07461.mRNA.3 hypothetical protein